MHPRFNDLVGAGLALLAVLVLAYVALVQRDQVAVGAMVGISSAGVAFFLRGKIEAPKP